MARPAILTDYGNIQMPESDNTLTIENNRLAENRRQFDAQNKQAKQKAGKDSLDFIDGLKVDHIGDTAVDLFNDAQIVALKNELVDMQLKGASAQDVKITAMQKLPKIAQGYTIAKDEYGKITEAQKNLLKDYPEGNAEAARNIMGKGMLDNIAEYNPDGTIKGYKDPSLINTNQNYSEKLFDPEEMDAWYPNTTDALVANIQKTRGLTPIEGQLKQINKRGGYTDKKYKGNVSIYHKPTVDDENKVTAIGLDSETVSLGANEDGTPNVIQVMPKEKYEVFRGDGKSAMQFDRAVYKHIKNDLGINPKSLDPQALDTYSRNYALNFLEESKLHGGSYNQFDVEKQDPVKNITNNNIRVGGAKEVPVMDIVTPVREYMDAGGFKKGLEGVAQLNIFNNEVTAPIVAEVKSRFPDSGVTADNIYYAKEGNDIWVMKADKAGKIDRKNDTPVFKLDDFSNVSGNKPQGQKSKNKALTQAQEVKEDKKPVTGYTNVQTLQDAKGKSIQAGVKNGKWYDIKTGKPIE